MSSADRLIEELRTEGRVDSPGEFTLDRAKAREKMRQFQLADARRYVLLLVEAAVLKGATRLEFEIDADDMRMRFDGRPFTAVDFDEIYGSLFSRADDDDSQARRRLALGLNAAMALHPRHVRVDSGDGAAGAFLELRPARADRFGPREGTPAGTRIHVRDRFRPGLVVSFVRNLRGTLAEESYLRERCCFSRVPVVLEGTRISRGLAADPAVPEERCAPVRGPGIDGVVALTHDADVETLVRFVSHGVLAGSQRIDTLPPGFDCLVENRAFRKDVSQDQIVHDEAHRAALEAVGDACDAVLARLAAGLGAMGDDAFARGVRTMLRIAARRHAGALRKHVTTLAPLSGLPERVMEAPLFLAIDGSFASLARLADEVRLKDECAYGRCDTPVPLPEGRIILHTPSAPDQELLAAALDKPLRDRSDEVRKLEERERRRQAWRRRKAPATLGNYPYAARRPLRTPPAPAAGAAARPFVEGEVAVATPWDERSTVAFLAQGCRLGERSLVLPVPGIRAVLSAGFAPNDDFDDVRNDETLAAAVLALVDALHPLFASLAPADAGEVLPPFERSALVKYLRAALDPWFAVRMLAAFGFSSQEARRLAEAPAGGPARPALRLDLRRSLVPAAEGQAPAEEAHPLASVPLFEALDGTRRSLHDLARARRPGEKIRWVGRSSSLGVPFRALPAGLPPQPSVLALDDAESGILQAVFGAAALHDAADDLEHEAHAARHAASPVEPVEPQGAMLAATRIAGEGFDGVLGIPAEPFAPGAGPSPQPPQDARVRLLRRRRFLAEIEIAVPFGPLRGVVNADAVRPNRDWTNADDPEMVGRIGAEVVAGSLRLLLGLRAHPGLRDPARPEALRRLFLAAAAAPFPAEWWRAVWDGLAARFEPPEAARQYARVLAFGVGRKPGDVQAALSLLGLPGGWAVPCGADPAAELVRIAGEPPETAERAETRAVADGFAEWLRDGAVTAALPLPAPLRDAPLLRVLGGPLVPPGELAGAGTPDGRVQHVPADFAEQPGDGGRVLRLDQDETAVLRRLLGADRLVDATGEVRRQRQERGLKARPLLKEIVLPPGATLLSERVAAGTVAGEVGLSASPSGVPHLSLTICKYQRVVTTVDLPAQEALCAILDDHRLALAPDSVDTPAAGEIERLAGVARGRARALQGRLVGGWDALTDDGRGAAWPHVLDALARVSPSALWLGGRALDDFEEALAALPGFRMADGAVVSLAEVRRRSRVCGRLLSTTIAGEYCVPSELRPWVVVVRPLEARRLEGFLAVAASAASLGPDEVRDVVRRAQARPFVVPREVDAFVQRTGRQGKVQALLYLPRQAGVPLTATFGRDDLEVETRSVSRTLPCAGFVWGDGLAVPPGFAAVALTEAQELWLEKLACEVHSLLAKTLKAEAKRGTKHPVAEGRLRDAVVALARARREHSTVLLLDQDALLDRLARRRLFPLGDGRRLNLEEVLERRPAELAHFGLWSGEDTAMAQRGVDDRGDREQQESRAEAQRRRGEQGGEPVCGPAAPRGVPAPPEGGPAAVSGPERPSGAPAEPARAGAAASPQAASTAGPPPAPAPASAGRRARAAEGAVQVGPPPPEVRFLGALADALRALQSVDRVALGGIDASRISFGDGAADTIAESTDEGIVIHRSHPAVRIALRSFESDRGILAFILSAIYTAHNIRSAAIGEADEVVFQGVLAAAGSERSARGPAEPEGHPR